MEVSYFSDRKTDDDYSLFFLINRIKGKKIIDYHKTNAPAFGTGSSTRRNFCGRSANEPICSSHNI